MQNLIKNVRWSIVALVAMGVVALYTGIQYDGARAAYEKAEKSLENARFSLELAEYHFCVADSEYAKSGLSKFYAGKIELTLEEADDFKSRAEKDCGEVPGIKSVEAAPEGVALPAL